MNALRQYGLAPNSRDQAVHMLKKLLDEYEKEHFGTNQEQSDEDYLSKFDDID
jgi:hypothetical protein